MKGSHGSYQVSKGHANEQKNEYRSKQDNAGKARGNERTGGKPQYGPKGIRGGKPGNNK